MDDRCYKWKLESLSADSIFTSDSNEQTCTEFSVKLLDDAGAGVPNAFTYFEIVDESNVPPESQGY